MTDDEYNARQKNAKDALLDAGEYRNAVKWLQDIGGPPHYWEGTPLEYALEKMPTGLARLIARFFCAIIKIT